MVVCPKMTIDHCSLRKQMRTEKVILYDASSELLGIGVSCSD